MSETTTAVPPAKGGGVDALIDWPVEALPTVATLFSMRRQWMARDFSRLRAEYEAATEAEGAPADHVEAERLMLELPSAPGFLWLHRHVQDRGWKLCERVVESRADDIAAALVPDEGDLGTLGCVDGFEYPAYYTFDYHRQQDGIWRSDAGAAIYLLGARLVHVGRNSDFQLHDQLVADIDLDGAPDRILDLGCGFGKTTFSIKKRWPDAQVVGYDLSAPCLKLGRKMATARDLEIDWMQCDVERLPDADGSVDLAVMSMVMHEMPEAAIRNTLAEAARVLKPGGKFVLLENRVIGDPFRDTVMKWYSDLIDEPYWERFRRLDLPAIAREVGFAEAKLDKWYLAGTDGPAAEADEHRWCTPWGLFQAVKGEA